MTQLDDLRAAVAAQTTGLATAQGAVADLRDQLATATPQERVTLARALKLATTRVTTATAALAAAQAALDAFVADPLAPLSGDHPIALLPVRLETRFVTDPVAPQLLVRVYPDELAIDDHRPGLTDDELAAAARFWDRVWRAGRSDEPAEKTAFVELADRVGTTRALWVVHATQPDERDRPTDPVSDATPLTSPPQLADAPHAGDTELAPAVCRVMPDRWTVLGFRGGARIVRADGAPIPDALQVGPSAAAPPAAPPIDGDPTPPLEEGLRWLADFDAAVAVGMGIRVPLTDTRGFDRLVVLGVRTTDDPTAGAQRLQALLDAQRYGAGLGFLQPGAPTNNSDADRSAWTRRTSAADAFDADRERDVVTTANAGATAAAFGIDAQAVAGVEHGADGDTRDTRGMQLALWPATVGYFMETLINPAIDDATVEAARELFVDALNGLGPLPVVRAGAQPYGLLPVMALSRWHPASADAAPHAKLVELLRRLAPEWLATTKPGAAHAVPHVGRAGADPDQELLDILGRDAQSGSYRLRPARGGAVSHALTPLIGTLDPAGEAIADAAQRLVGGGTVQPRLASFQWESRTARIRRAPVIDGTLSEADPLPPEPASGSNYLQFLANRSERTGAFAGPGVHALLFKLAQHSCALADADAAVRLGRPPSVVAAKAALEPDLVDPAPDHPSDTMPRLLARDARDVVSAQLPAGRTVAQLVATATLADFTRLGFGDIGPAVARAGEVRAALGSLGARPTALLDRLTRAALDVCSHRLDAWMTAYATRRLADVRALHPDGVLVGGYGWVEDLRPKPAPTPVTTLPPGEAGPLFSDPSNAGYVAAPSPVHAATAALLLSGHLSHRGAAGAAADAFAVDLSSDRVRLATWLLDGIRQGQPLGALLGYRFERGLHDASGDGVELDRFIRPFRALAPLVAGRSDDVAATLEAVEAAAASNVVDGLTLLSRVQANASFVDPTLVGATAAERTAVLAQLALLADAADALADLATAETVYQLAAGNVARAAASLDALGSGLNVPPEPEVVRTPRGGFAHTHRLLCLAPSGAAVPAGWARGARRPRRVAEPRLDAWVAGLLGPADRIRAALRVVGADGAIVSRSELTIAQAGACALDLVYDPSADLELMLADVVIAGGEVPAGARVELVHDDAADWPGASWPADTVGLDDALEQARWIADAIGAARPLSAIDLAPPGVVTDAGIDDAELAARVAAVAALYRAASAALADALAAAAGPQTDARTRAALRALAEFGLAGARQAAAAPSQPAASGSPRPPAATAPSQPPSTADPALTTTANAFLAETAGVIKLLDAPQPDAAADLAALQAIFGPAFRILPTIEPATATTATAWADAVSAGAKPAFLHDDPAAPRAWLQRVAPTRAPIERYLLATAGNGGTLAVAQIPTANLWVALALAKDQDEPAANATSILVHGAPADAAAPGLAGLVIDEWTDVIPARDTTAAVAFQFDEPGARAPQSILLAVQPQLGASWSIDVLADTITETADLARIRMVGPEEVPWLGRYLPALYVADNVAGDTLTVNVQDLVATTQAGPT